MTKIRSVPGGIWSRDLSHSSPLLYQLSYQGLVKLEVDIRVEIRILAQDGKWTRSAHRRYHRPAGIFNFMLDLVSDNEIDGLVDLIPQLSSTLL